MQYVVIDERLMKPQRQKWDDAKKIKLDYWIANINPECWDQCKARMPIINKIINMIIISHTDLTLFCTQSHKLGIEVALWHQNTSNIQGM